MFSELQPYALYPLDEYFQRFTRTVDARPLPVPYARHPNGEPLRPPLARCAPQAHPVPVPVVPVVPEPVPVLPAMSLDIMDPAAVASHIRARFHAGRALGFIVREMNLLQVPAPNGAEWRVCDVKHSLLHAPRPRLPKAA